MTITSIGIGGSSVAVMTGATALTAGTAGLVPAPSAGAQGKVLYGNGQWGALPPALPTLAAVATSGSFADLLNRPLRGLSCQINGGGSAIPTGVIGFMRVPYACTVMDWTLLGTPSGSLTVDIWAGALASFGSISGANTICAGTPPAISSGVEARGTALVSWTTTIAANTVLIFNVTSAATVTMANLTLSVAA